MTDYIFNNNGKDKEKLLIVLAGYKPFLWDLVFERLSKYITDDIDVCIVTSGLRDEHLYTVAMMKNWSYLSTTVNNLCLAQNLCIEKFPNAKYIFKMDEDMFVTKDCFTKMFATLDCVKKNSMLEPSCVVPVINVNCVSFYKLFDVRTEQTFFNKYPEFKLSTGLYHHKYLLEDPEVAKFMWENVNIDECEVVKSYHRWEPSPMRYSIGLVLFEREKWELWGKFDVLLDSEKEYERIGMGIDERKIARFSMMQGYPTIIDNTTVVGHFAYGPQQTAEYIQWFEENRKLFEIS